MSFSKFDLKTQLNLQTLTKTKNTMYPITSELLLQVITDQDFAKLDELTRMNPKAFYEAFELLNFIENNLDPKIVATGLEVIIQSQVLVPYISRFNFRSMLSDYLLWYLEDNTNFDIGDAYLIDDDILTGNHTVYLVDELFQEYRNVPLYSKMVSRKHKPTDDRTLSYYATQVIGAPNYWVRLGQIMEERESELSPSIFAEYYDSIRLLFLNGSGIDIQYLYPNLYNIRKSYSNKLKLDDDDINLSWIHDTFKAADLVNNVKAKQNPDDDSFRYERIEFNEQLLYRITKVISDITMTDLLTSD